VSGDIDVILFHPTHVHVPTPRIQPSSALSKGKITGKSPLTSKSAPKPTKAERESSLLIKDIVNPLTQRGLIAATLSTGVRKWQGVVRLPERSEHGEWEDRSKRVELVKDNNGLFRRMDLK
jgi:DNA polymerase beta